MQYEELLCHAAPEAEDAAAIGMFVSVDALASTGAEAHGPPLERTSEARKRR